MKTKLLFTAAILLCSFANAFAQKAEPKQIKLARGKSSATVSGTLSNNNEMDYVFSAKAGQKIILKVTSLPKGGFFDFTIAGDGFDVETEYDSYADYSFTALQTGNYLVTVRKRPTQKATTAKFFLTLSIK